MKKNKKYTKKNSESPLIFVTTGGSGGHIFPAESIADALLKKGYRVVFVTDKRGSTFQSLPGVQVYRLMAESVARRSLWHKGIAGMKLVAGAVQALFLIQKLRPALVIGVGGYASFPAVIAAQAARVPVILHEQNAVLGRANRVLARGAKLIATSFDKTSLVPEEIKQLRVGMPARPQVMTAQKSPYPTDTSSFNLLIFGGSQGAMFFSRRFPEVIAKLPADIQKKLMITQQARPEDKDYLTDFYSKLPLKKVVIESFFDNMPDLMKKAHLIIARGGASTITELEIIGRPALIVPLPTAADNHQMENAKQFCDSNAGWLVNEKTFDADQVAKQLEKLIETPDMLKNAADCAIKRACPNAAAAVAEEARKIVEEAC